LLTDRQRDKQTNKQYISSLAEVISNFKEFKFLRRNAKLTREHFRMHVGVLIIGIVCQVSSVRLNSGDITPFSRESDLAGYISGATAGAY